MLSMETARGENPALSYRNMRAIIGSVGLTLPAVLLLAGVVDGHFESSLSAFGVAFFHAAPQNATLSQLRLADVHLACAVALFTLLGAISLFIFPRDVMPEQRRRTNWYMALGALIWLSIILMPTLNSLTGSFYDSNHVFFILETACVMAFAALFILKGHGQPGDPGLNKAADRPGPSVGLAATPAFPVAATDSCGLPGRHRPIPARS